MNRFEEEPEEGEEESEFESDPEAELVPGEVVEIRDDEWDNWRADEVLYVAGTPVEDVLFEFLSTGAQAMGNVLEDCFHTGITPETVILEIRPGERNTIAEFVANNEIWEIGRGFVVTLMVEGERWILVRDRDGNISQYFEKRITFASVGGPKESIRFTHELGGRSFGIIGDLTRSWKGIRRKARKRATEKGVPHDSILVVMSNAPLMEPVREKLGLPEGPFVIETRQAWDVLQAGSVSLGTWTRVALIQGLDSRLYTVPVWSPEQQTE